MKLHISRALAALLAASAVSIATAAAPTPNYVTAPIASSFKADGPQAEQMNTLVQALNGEASLQGSKITVQIDDGGNVLLTGATDSQEQAERAAQIATSQAGQGKVVNAIVPGRVTYRTWEAISG
jgi:osmotically-inducible protein OsmY